MASSAVRMARWRARQREDNKPTQKRETRTGNRHVRARAAPFLGVDGEGCGTDDLGRQHYMLLRAGERELYTGDPLTTAQCLEFLCGLPPSSKACPVGFSFGYDVTMILRDLSPERRARLLAPKGEAGFNAFVWWNGYGIAYLPRNFFRVCRSETTRNADGTFTTRAIKGTSRTIYETFGFFQCSFLAALKQFKIGTEYLDFVETNKLARATFDEITPDIRRYCGIECDLLAQLMEQLRTNCAGAGIVPRTWNGAGKLAAALHRQRATPRRADLVWPNELERFARAAYYGGRFEVTRVGMVSGPIHGSDICSAYPDAMRKLPCLTHGTWEQVTGADMRKLGPDELYVSECRFDHSRHHDLFPGEKLNLCGLPIRKREGYIHWPAQGNGVYWSPEIKAAEKLGCRVYHKSGWKYVKRCNCEPFAWIEELYEYRKSLGKSAAGYPIKLAINSLYGKLAQRIGSPTWGNFIWAGLITAMTRAKLMDAASQNPSAIIMLATDGIFSTAPLDLDYGAKLGQWEAETHPHIFVVQPGLYWGPPKPKTRGIPAKFFETRTGQFEAAWAAFRRADKAGRKIASLWPSVILDDFRMFIGLKLAQARNKPETAGQWKTCERKISFDPFRKRARHEWSGDHVRVWPHAGGRDLYTVYHGDQGVENLELWDNAKMELDDQPDYVDLSIPWR